MQPILKFAGQDISHWFDPKTKEVRAPRRPRSLAHGRLLDARAVVSLTAATVAITLSHSRCAQPKTHISPQTGLRQSYTPFGRFLHIPPSDPAANWDNSFETSWWHDQQFQVGA